MREALHITGIQLPAGADPAKFCEIHDWPVEKLMTDLMPLMRAKHGKGGVNACTPCIERAKAEADRRRGITPC